MSVPHRVFALVLIGSVLLAACGSAGPTPTSLPATATPAPTGLPTPAPPTDPPAPTLAPVKATDTVPPAATQPPAPQAPAAAEGLIAFYSERDGNAEIYTMSPEGGDQVRLTFNAFEDSAPALSPDGRQIAFISDRDDSQPGACFPHCTYQLYLINVDGSGERRLVETELTTHHPDWHPDGTRLSFDTEFNLEGDTYLVSAGGGDPELLIEDGFWADWSPDGSQIAFASNREGNLELYVANADGGNRQRLTGSEDWELFPAWSPDGAEIAYFGCDPGCRPDRQDLYVMGAVGGQVRRLTGSPSTVDEDPAWSPDGQWIAFQSDRDRNYEIYLVAAGGGEPVRLTNSRGGDYWPSWGPAAPPAPGGALSFVKSEQTFAPLPTWKIGLGIFLVTFGLTRGPNEIWFNTTRQ